MRPSDQHGIQLADKPQKGWRACWGKLHCFALSSRKCDRHRPLLPAPSAGNPRSNGNLQISESMPSSSSLSPLVHAPPSSPASFTYTEHVPSPAALLTLFPLKCVEDLCSNATPRGESSFRGLDPVLVTPPLHSTLTTEPTTPLSTAPFTPPPELAHLTTPPSPEVPFAELVVSSLSVKCAEQVSDQITMMGASMVSKNNELGYQVFSRNPITFSEVSSTEVPSPLPERVTFLQDDTGSTSITSLLERASPFGFNQVTSADAYGHCSPELIYQHVAYKEESQHVQEEDVRLKLKSDAETREEHLQTPQVEHSFQQRSEEQQDLQFPSNGNERRQSEIPDLILSANCAQVSEVSCSEKIEDGHGFFPSSYLPESSNAQQPDGWNSDQSPSLATQCSMKKNVDGKQCPENCPTCEELTSKCRLLSEALHKTKEKLSLIKEKENMIDDREKKYKQILDWLQSEAKSQQASINRLSEELSWQDAEFLDLQAKYLAELGIELPPVCKDHSTT